MCIFSHVIWNILFFKLITTCSLNWVIMSNTVHANGQFNHSFTEHKSRLIPNL